MINASTRCSFRTARAPAITSAATNSFFARAHLGDEMAAIGGADHGAAARHDPAGAAPIEHDEIARR